MVKGHPRVAARQERELGALNLKHQKAITAAKRADWDRINEKYTAIRLALLKRHRVESTRLLGKK
jgi:hypothetical protein